MSLRLCPFRRKNDLASGLKVYSASPAFIRRNYGWLPLTGVGTGLRLARQQRSQTSSG
jgi:hypothetical protein